MITGVILARNEENNIVDCIKSIRPHVSELILIDMDSSDDTVSLAQSFVDKVLHHSLVANFDPVRNIAIPEANNEWFWFIDADERVSDQTASAVHKLINIRGDTFEAINIPFKTYFCGKWIEHSGWWPGYTMPRVLKKGFFKFSERLHGGVELDGREIRLPPDPALGVDHYSYLSIEHYIEKLNRYTSTEAAQLQESNQSIDWRNGIAHMVHDLWMYYERNQGYLDGRHGWILAWLSGQYRWLSHAKLIDENPDALEDNAQVAPYSLSDVFSVISQEMERLRSSNFQLPDGIVWRSPIWDPSGYADEGRCIAKALSRTDRHVAVENIPWNDTVCEISGEDQALLRSMSRCKRADTNIVITNCIPTLVEPDRSATFNIIRTTFETDRIPEEWIPRLNAFDEIWVISKQNELSFRRSGVAPEKLRRVASFLDTGLYKPEGTKQELPEELRDRFVFLSVFDWQLRKGWDILLRAYCNTFDPDDGAGLLLKISRMHGESSDDVYTQASELLKSIDQDLDDRNDIHFIDQNFTATEMAGLYRAVNAFALPTRGEGWGRPYMEAMACGLPTIGTAASGNIDFMNDENSVLVDAKPVPVSDEAAKAIPPYAGHRWWEPDEFDFGDALRSVFENDEYRKRIGANGTKDIKNNFGLESGQAFWETALADVEKRFANNAPVEINPGQTNVVLEGELFANHSFANINEQLAEMFIHDSEFAFAIDRKFHNPVFDRENVKQGMISRYVNSNDSLADVTIRHAFPPNWIRPQSGKWIHIQPWEFGHLPKDWISPLVNDVDEIWVPSHYVRDVYVNSGVPTEKIFVIPWGVDLSIFNTEVPARILPTNKRFRFLFVGGTIARKGFDRLLEAYLQEFSNVDDVTLVIKDLGTKTFYRYGNYSEPIANAQNDPNSPEIVYFDEQWTAGQVAGLYAACDCLVMPYRGEGFGLPILEAMACGIPPVVPNGGASDDFVDETTGIFIEGTQTESTHEWELAGPALELEVSVDELCSKMRWAYEHKNQIDTLGIAAADAVQENWSWLKSYHLMRERIKAIASGPSNLVNRPHIQTPQEFLNSSVAVCIKTKNDELDIANCISRFLSDIEEVVVFDDASTDDTVEIANEYGVNVINVQGDFEQYINEHITSDWYVVIDPSVILSESEIGQMEKLIRLQPEIATEVTMRLEDSSFANRPDRLFLMRNTKSKVAAQK